PTTGSGAPTSIASSSKSGPPIERHSAPVTQPESTCAWVWSAGSRVADLGQVRIVAALQHKCGRVLRFCHVHTSHVTYVTGHGRPAPSLEPRQRPNRYRKCRKTGHFLASVRSLLLLTYCSKRHWTSTSPRQEQQVAASQQL